LSPATCTTRASRSVARWFKWLAVLLLAVSGVLAVAEFATAQDAGGVHGSVHTGMIRDRIGVFATAEAEIPVGFGNRIYVPKFEVALVNDATGARIASAKTDVYGRFYFRYQPAGIYRVCWDSPGWIAGCSPEKPNIKNNIVHVASIAVHPAIRKLADGTVRGAFWGRVKLADGSSPFFSEEYFGVERTAEVTVTDLS